MSIRYRKSIRLAPGVKLNLNAKSVSVTTGVRGAHVTYNSKGYRTTSLSAPGTGLSYRTTTRIPTSGLHHDDKIILGTLAAVIIVPAIIGAIAFVAFIVMLLAAL